MEATTSSDSYNTPTMLASQTFERILQSIQKSNLNFVLQVSPYSANISLKKSLVTDKSGAVCFPPELSSDLISREALATLKANKNILENTLLSTKQELAAAKDECEAAHTKIKILKEEKDDETAAYLKSTKILEEKVNKAEAKSVKFFEEKKIDVEAYRKQIKTLNDEINARKKEIVDLKKVSKEKEKDLCRVSNKCENLESTVRRIKAENTTLKNEKKKLERSQASENRKKGKTITRPFPYFQETSFKSSTGNTSSECISFNVSPGNSPLNTTPSCNNNICDSIETLPRPEPSPHTPPGPPPTSSAGLPNTSSPAPGTTPSIPPSTEPHTSQEYNTDAGDPEPNDMKGIKVVNDDFVKLLEEIKNAKLTSDDEREDDYGATDYECYPDYYWQMGYETDDGKYFEQSEEELVSHHSPL